MSGDTVFVDNPEKRVHGVKAELAALDSDVGELPATGTHHGHEPWQFPRNRPGSTQSVCESR